MVGAGVIAQSAVVCDWKKMKVQEEAYKVLWKRSLEKADSKILVEWAVDAFKLGYETESLLILAGLDNDSTEERERYFWKAIDELNLNVEREESRQIHEYAKYIARAVSSKEISPEDGLRKMMDVYYCTSCSSKYFQFYILKDVIDDQRYAAQIPKNSHENLTDRMNGLIRKEFESFLATEELGVGAEIRERAFCNNCGNIGEPARKIRFQLKMPFIYRQLVCENCKSPNIDRYFAPIE